MIAALLILLFAAEEPKILHVRIEGDGHSTPCVARIRDRQVDLTNDRELAEAFAEYPPADWVVEMSGPEEVAYRCIGALFYRIHTGGYKFAKQGIVIGSAGPE